MLTPRRRIIRRGAARSRQATTHIIAQNAPPRAIAWNEFASRHDQPSLLLVAEGEDEAGVAEGAANALAVLVNRGTGQPYYSVSRL